MKPESLRRGIKTVSIHTKRTKVPMSDGVRDQTTSKGMINCLAGPCRLARYETRVTSDNEPDYIILWCAHQGEAVIDMKACPDGKWKKTDSGYPVKTDPGVIRNQMCPYEQNRSNRTAHIS